MPPLYKVCQEPSPSVKDTTCFIIILQHTIVMATDSQQTLYDGGILYLTTKLSLVSDSPPKMSLRCNDMVDSTMALDFVTSQASRARRFNQIVRSVKYYMKRINSCCGYMLILCSVEVNTPKGHYLQEVVVPNHFDGCAYQPTDAQ
ncbi:hypothetical protein C1H46_020115 [Malus baccata]|uniref:Uncharacterized protein n=1 Tax=Malus baccata TaxID=106549 RepID=A0A540M6C2_MALBA|nr:hypothetical protein C1H46_020115 [Malus baccata]